jgi:hypothetical protein
MSTYRKFSSRFAGEGDKPKTFASFATFTDDIQNFEAGTDTDGTQIETPEIRNASVKVAQVAKVETAEAQDAKTGTLDHPQNLRSPSVPEAAAAEPSSTRCKVEIVELPAAARYRKVFGFLQLKPPALVAEARWRLCVSDGSRFLAKWGDQAQALNWTSADLFGLHTPPERPHPSYSRLSRYDCTGLIWLLQGRPVVALTEATAAIRNPTTGNITVYRRENKPALGPVGDSLDDHQ